MKSYQDYPTHQRYLKDTDIILINTSAGKDSLVMMDVIVAQAREQGVVDRCVAVHADLGRAEWAGTRELAERQAAKYGIRFEVISRPQGDLLEQVEARGMWPSSKQRYCTSDHKRGQVAKVVTMLTDEIRAEKPGHRVRILNCMGFRRQESSFRAKKEVSMANARLTNGKRIVEDWHPILDWAEGEVWDYITTNNLEYHQAYDLGMPRLSCVFCIFAPKKALMIAGKHNPELLDEYVRIEETIGHTFKADMAIKSIQTALDSGEAIEVGTVESWCM